MQTFHVQLKLGRNDGWRARLTAWLLALVIAALVLLFLFGLGLILGAVLLVAVAVGFVSLLFPRRRPDSTGLPPRRDVD